MKMLVASRVATPRAAVNMSMKPRANRRVQVNQELLLFQFVYHYAVPCRVRLCKKKSGYISQTLDTAKQKTLVKKLQMQCDQLER